LQHPDSQATFASRKVRLDGGLSAVELFGGFLPRFAFEIAQHNGAAIPFRDICQLFVQYSLKFPRMDIAKCILLLNDRFDQQTLFALPCPFVGSAQGRPERDAVQPGTQRADMQ
jgi:hypothetical protein